MEKSGRCLKNPVNQSCSAIFFFWQNGCFWWFRTSKSVLWHPNRIWIESGITIWIWIESRIEPALYATYHVLQLSDGRDFYSTYSLCASSRVAGGTVVLVGRAGELSCCLSSVEWLLNWTCSFIVDISCAVTFSPRFLHCAVHVFSIQCNNVLLMSMRPQLNSR